MDKLKRVEIEGFKSIKDVGIDLGDINILIGANGAGKSNFISVFKMLNFMTTDSLQLYIGRSGGANSLLHYGSKSTHQMKVALTFDTETGESEYFMRLFDAAPDTLIFAEEKVFYHAPGRSLPQEVPSGSGHKETFLNDYVGQGEKTVAVMRNILRNCQVFQFHDTSDESRLRKEGNIIDNRFLRKDAGNLAAYLYMLRKNYPENYKRIVSTIKITAPHFKDFDLEPSKLNPNSIILNWREIDNEYSFGPHQLPDGLLRFMALVTLLLQPRENIPNLIVIDEPELGLHPYAINMLGALIREASHSCQILIATQSPIFLDQFEDNSVKVVERKQDNKTRLFETKIESPNLDTMKEWRNEDYTLGEIWQKNIIGGRPGK